MWLVFAIIQQVNIEILINTDWIDDNYFDAGPMSPTLLNIEK